MFQIRKAQVSDLKSVHQLASEIWPQAFAGIIKPEQISKMLKEIYSLPALEKEYKELGHVFWLAEKNNEDIAYASAYEKEQTLWLKKIYIKTQEQGQGCGKALMQAAIANFPNSKRIALYVNKDNKKAQDFYQRQGFTIEAETPVMMGSLKFTDYIMSKSLTDDN